MDKVILHSDLNGFYASVECLLYPEYANVPMAVAGNPENRHGIILAKNELAKKYNIQTAETIWKAKQKCPELLLVPPHRNEYTKYSKIVNNIYNEFTDLIEPFGIDESFLDVTGVTHLFGNGKEIADKLRETVKERTGLTISVGVSFNKIFAKLGSDYKKPDATTVISKENYKEIVWPLPVTALLYVGKSVYAELQKMNVKTIGQLAALDKNILLRRFGKTGEILWEYANGFDDSPVRPFEDISAPKSVGNGMTFKRDLKTRDDIKLAVISLSEEVAFRLRRHGYKCNTVQINIKYFDFKSISRQKGVSKPTFLEHDIYESAMELVDSLGKSIKPIRTLTVTAANLIPADEAIEQLSLLDFSVDNSIKHEKREKLEDALYNIRNKYGRDSVINAGKVKNDIGITKGIVKGKEDKEELSEEDYED